MRWIGYLLVVFSLTVATGCTQNIDLGPDEHQVSELETFDVVSTRRMANKTAESAVEVINPFAGRGSGTYYKIDGHYVVLTAAHVVHMTEVAFVEGRNDEVAMGHVVYRDEQNDLAVILIPELDSRKAMKYKPVSEGDFRGTEVLYTGFPARHDLFTAYGRIAGATSQGNLLLHSYAWMGASGSNIFDTRGRLVGVLYAVDLGSSPYDPYRVLPPHVVEDVVHVSPVWRLDMDAIVSDIEACAEGVCRQE